MQRIVKKSIIKRLQSMPFAKKLWVLVPAVLLVSFFMFLIFKHYADFSWNGVSGGMNQDLLVFFLIGVFAQLIDGSMGMGYGAISSSFLIAYGVSPVVSSAGVHVSEMFTTGVSAISQHRFGNINKKLVRKLLIPGILGSITGAYLLSDVIDGNYIKPFIAIYMAILAISIIKKAFEINIVKKKFKQLTFLGYVGGFMDSIGGGGWGPIVSTTLIYRGRNARYTIGSVNFAEFAVAFASGVTFMIFGGINNWQLIIGLIIGGVIAAPVAASLLGKADRRYMMIIVGILIILLSINTILKCWFF